jgi:signal transduction histidine kinase
MTSTRIESLASEPAPARRLRLQHRIVLPLILVALVATGTAAWVAVSVTSSAMRARLESQLVNSAIAVSRGGLALNPAILRNLRDIVGAEIITLAPDGALVATSLPQRDSSLVAVARQVVLRTTLAPGGQPQVAVGDCGFPCVIVVGDVQSQTGARVALVAETSSLTAATWAVARAILWSALASVVVLVLASQAVVSRVTAPLARLVGFVRTLAPEDSTRRAEVGNDETGALAEAFNGLLDRLGQSRAALVRSEKLGLAGLFAARVAHDIRNPLSSIKMQAQLLRSKVADDEDDRDTLASVLRDVDQVESVVRDLMDLANPGALRVEPAAVNGVIDDALAQVAAQFAYRKITVDRQLTEGLPLVPLDRPRLKQALLNVLVNGAEAMHTGGQMTVASGLSSGPAAASSVWIRICDDGVGVDPAVLDRVFDPFVSTKPEGVGLGLVNVKAVVEGHGGRITLEPRQPRGTCVQMWLPVVGPSGVGHSDHG